MNERCVGIGRSVGPEIGRAKTWLSNSPDHPISGSPDHPIARSPDQTGFTLFEMLLSITLIGFLMVALLVGLRVASRAWRTGEAHLRQVHAEGERHAFVVEQISSLVPYQVTLSESELQGTFVILQASARCLRFVSSYSSGFRSRSGLILAEYGIVPVSPGNVEVALRETPVGDNEALLRRLIRSVTNDPETGVPRVDYQPFLLRGTDLPLMTGLGAAWFEYLEQPKKGPGPVWRQDWKSTDEAPYPEAIRLRWRRGNQVEEELFPVLAKFRLRSATGQ